MGLQRFIFALPLLILMSACASGPQGVTVAPEAPRVAVVAPEEEQEPQSRPAPPELPPTLEVGGVPESHEPIEEPAGLVGRVGAQAYDSVQAFCAEQSVEAGFPADDPYCDTDRLGRHGHEASWGSLRLVLVDTHFPDFAEHALAFSTPEGIFVVNGVGLEQLSGEQEQTIVDVRFEEVGPNVAVTFVYESGERVWTFDGPGSEQGWKQGRVEEQYVCGPRIDQGFGCVEQTS